MYTSGREMDLDEDDEVSYDEMLWETPVGSTAASAPLARTTSPS